MWTFRQSTGELIDPDGKVIGTGYAGYGKGLNNPEMQSVRNVGPLPAGQYTIGAKEPCHGALGTNVAALTPHSTNEMFGRGSFYLHGRKSLTDLTASEGCIILDYSIRIQVLNSSDRELEVVA